MCSKEEQKLRCWRISHRVCTFHHSRVMHKFPAKMGPRSTENDATSVLTEDLNSGTSKTSITDVSCKSN